jgi:hypothetical protein
MVKTANTVLLNLLLEKSKERYIMTYVELLKFRKLYKTKFLTENVSLTILTNYLQKLNHQLYGLFIQCLKA